MVSEQTGISVRRLQTTRFRGEGPAYRKLGTSVRYVEGDVASWLEAIKVVPGATTTASAARG